MERAVYAQCWFPRSHCYHPSLPPRRLGMVEDFAAYKATMLTWPAMGGGGISLPYLQSEVDGPIPPRFRQYGFLNDREFVAECQKRGIKAFSVIFSVQGWEFPAELNEDESEVLAMNELRGVGTRTWLGLREFTQGRYPKIWGALTDYFPDGLTNSDGDPVTDLWEECCSRDVAGEALHGDWLECPDRDHICHYMDTNNPVWREYLKAVVRIQVDAGVDGIQFDEPDGPLGALRYGGCFCKDCMKGFRAYLQALPLTDVPAELVDSLDGFDYRSWMIDHGLKRIDTVQPDFLVKAYVQYQRGCTARNIRELAGYVREYAASVGREVLVSSNFFDGAPSFDPVVSDLDIVVPEQRNTLYRQPAWMRFIAGFGSGKAVAISVNPYGGVLDELSGLLRRGLGDDRYRTIMYEAAAFGVNMSVPYGAWMGSVVIDAFYAPHDLTVEIENFLADHDRLISPSSFNDVAVLYSVDSNFLDVMLGNVTGQDARYDESRGRVLPLIAFDGVTRALADQNHPFDTVMLHDGILREDDLTSAGLRRYPTVIAPGCHSLTTTQIQALRGYLDDGGHLVVVGPLGGASPDSASDVSWIEAHPQTRIVDPDDTARLIVDEAQVIITGVGDVGVNIAQSASGTAAVHLINYGYSEERSATIGADDVELIVRVPYPTSHAHIFDPSSDRREVDIATTGGYARIPVGSVANYLIVELLRD